MDWDGDRYHARLDALAASGQDLHGEVNFVLGLDPAPRPRGPGGVPLISVLDAGCGTGRVAIELARRGVPVAGLDADASMLATAARVAPDLEWVLSDLAAADLGRTFDVVVMAGNVPLFTPPGTQTALVAGCVRHLSPGGALVAGFSLGSKYPLTAYDADCRSAGLVLAERYATWDREPFRHGDYAVSVHRWP
jgi:SAM-dependent methyltransferase